MNNMDSENLVSINILQSQKQEIKKIVENGEFTDVSEFVINAVSKELDLRKWLDSSEIILGENQIKEKLELWIEEIFDKAMMDKKSKK